MATIIEMPKLSDTMTTGTLVKWLRNEGDKIASGDVIAEVETDKATMDLEAFDDGTLLKIVAPAGAVVACKAPIGIIGEPGEKFDDLLNGTPAGSASAPDKKEKPAPAPSPESKAPAESAPAPVPAPSTDANSGSRVKASPLAKKVAAEKGVDLAGLAGSGPGGRIVKQDVLSAPAGGTKGTGWGLYPKAPIAKAERIPLTSMRQTIARRLLESKTQIPHFYLTIEVDAGPLVALRQSLNDSLSKLPKPIKLSLNDFILKATAEALRRVPGANASFEGDAIRQHPDVQLAFAVAIEQGLITPVVSQAQNKNLLEISQDAKSLAGRAKEGKLKPEEYTTGTFTVSNLGMYGIDNFQAIINPPQAAILAVANVVKKPVVNENDEIVVGHRLNLTLSCDHRVVDGAVGASFLQELRALIEKPALLLL